MAIPFHHRVERDEPDEGLLEYSLGIGADRGWGVIRATFDTEEQALEAANKLIEADTPFEKAEISFNHPYQGVGTLTRKKAQPISYPN